MADNIRRKCFKCGGSPRDDPNIKLYRFPNPGPTNSLRCELWAKYCFPEEAWSSIALHRKLYNEHRMLCNQHFKISSFTDFGAKKLNRHAVPDNDNAENQPTIQTVEQQEPEVLLDITNIHRKLSEPQPGPSGEPPIKKAKMLESQFIPGVPSVEITLHDMAKTSKESHPGPSGVLLSKITNNPLYEKCRTYMKKVWQLKNEIKKMKAEHRLNVLYENEAVQNLSKNVTSALALMLQGEIKNSKRKNKGRRWSIEEKIIALRIYKRSPATYRLLRSLWCLPAPSTLKNLLGQFHVFVGLNDKVFTCINNYINSQEPINNNYILIFDEMSIKKHLWYNRKEDKVEGYQDHGRHGRTHQVVTHALVFMVAGIRKRVKQPVAFYLSSSNVTADRLSILIKDVLKKCFQNNINIVATVCDMGGVNRRALNLLGATKDHPYFSTLEREVVTIFDPPHLLKCFRNLFMKYDIECDINITSNNLRGQGIAKWRHIEDFFEIDNKDANFVFAPKLKKEHLNPNTKQKMRVNLAAQILSHTVAAGMYARISQGLLPAEATATAAVISNIDKLFDCLNADTPDRKNGKPYSTNMSDTSPHIEYFNKMKTMFETLKFLECLSSPPSKQGWIWTINAVLRLFNNLKQNGIKFLSTRRLQQDPLENLFGTIRANCGANYNPTTGQFIAALKTAVLSNLAHMGSGNCKLDNCSAMTDFKEIFSSVPNTVSEDISVVSTTDISSETESPLLVGILSFVDNSFNESMNDPQELQASAYVCGFLLKILKNQCLHCNVLLKCKDTNKCSLYYTFMEFKEYDDIKKRLNYASEEFIKCVENSATLCNNFYEISSHCLNIRKSTINKLKSEINFSFLEQCQEHFNSNVEFITKSVFYITIKRFCTVKNRQFIDDKKALRRKMDIVQSI